MSRRRVEKIAPISATSSSAAVDIGQTNSILSDPDGRWVAKRQSAITAGLERRRADLGGQSGSRSADMTIRHSGAGADKDPKKLASAKEGPSLKFSGESERIGEGNWDEKTSFGKHVGYL